MAKFVFESIARKLKTNSNVKIHVNSKKGLSSSAEDEMEEISLKVKLV